MPCSVEEFNRFRLGDEAVFEKIFVFYKPMLFNRFKHVNASSVEVEEIVQETFVQLFLRREHIPNVESIFPFLYVVGKRISISNFRKALVREKYHIAEKSQWNEIYDYLDSYIEQRDYSNILESFIKKLPPQQQTIFRKNKLEELSYKEIAADMGISPHTVKNHLVSACNFIRLKFDKIFALSFLIKVFFD